MERRTQVVVIGGGAAGFFGAIECASHGGCDVTLVEATAHLLAKVRVSGGGRCNVTHACFDPAQLVKGYPRGSRELLGPFTRFGPAQTVEWYQTRGVELKTEKDGRMFPVTDDSATIVDCLMKAAREGSVAIQTGRGVKTVARNPAGAGPTFTATLVDGTVLPADRVLVATGGGKTAGGLAIAQALGHTVVPPVPSLFTFHIDDPRIKGLEGVAAPEAAASIKGTRFESVGPALVTHWGLSGPAILKLSSWAARELHDLGYRFTLGINWAGKTSPGQARALLEADRAAHPKRRVASSNPFGLPARLWERLVAAAAMDPAAVWAGISNELLGSLAAQVTATEFAVTGKSMNKEEFVTCGGVRLSEVNMATMESRVCPGLHFAGEVLDIDGVTGGYNFQSAWTTGWQAGRAMAGA